MDTSSIPVRLTHPLGVIRTTVTIIRMSSQLPHSPAAFEPIFWVLPISLGTNGQVSSWGANQAGAPPSDALTSPLA